MDESGVANIIVENLSPSTKYYCRCSFYSKGVLEQQRATAIRLQAAAEAEVLSYDSSNTNTNTDSDY